MSSLIASALDYKFEEEVRRNPYKVSTWWDYAHSKNIPFLKFAIFERAVYYLPRSYKLWHAYLNDRKAQLKSESCKSPKYELLLKLYERALTHLNKMPRIWLDYCELLIYLHRGTQTRKTFDRALQSLPITQHKEIWKFYISWVHNYDVPETTIRIYRRYLMFDDAKREEYIEYLEEIEQYGEACVQLTILLNDESFVSSSGKTYHQLWMKLCDLCSKHPLAVVNILNVEEIIRSGIKKFSDEVGRLWTSLANFYLRLGQLEKVRDVYEEAISSVSTVRDFTIVFDAYLKVEESILSTKIQFLQEYEEEIEDDRTEEEKREDANEINLRLSRIEYLMEKRPFMVNSVLLRQNPQNIHEWLKRIRLFSNDDKKRLITYQDAIQTLNPDSVIGKLSSIYFSWANFYEAKKDIESCREVFSKAVKVEFKNVDELANIWCGWAEMEMRFENYDDALKVMQSAVEEPVQSIQRKKMLASAQGKGELEDNTFKVTERVYKDTKIWSLYLDLEESLGSTQSCRAAYERALDLKIITAQMALNYASFLEERNFFEESFTVYEKAISIFQFPQVKKIWLVYFEKFTARYENTKLERLRDLYEQVLQKAPLDDVAEFFIKYAKMEEQFGLARHVVSIYDRAVASVPEKNKLDMYRLYIKKVEQLFGIIKTRAIFDKALKVLNDDMTRELCLDYAKMERSLGEIDRARKLYQFGSQFADPKIATSFWLNWREFEESHGNVETFREMLRVQRSVELIFSSVNSAANEIVNDIKTKSIESLKPNNAMDFLSSQEPQITGEKRKFVPASNTPAEDQDQSNKISRNNEEIEI